MRAAEGGQRNEVRSRSNLDLAPSSELRYLGRSASRQSSLRINRDCQQTATTYLLYQSRTYTEHQIFLAFHKLLKRYMKAQQLVQCMIPRALFGGVWNTSKSVYCFQHVAADVFSFFGLSCTLFPVRSRCVFFPSPSNHRIISHDRIYVEQNESMRLLMFWGPADRISSPTEKINAKTIIRICPFRQILSCSELAN